MTAKSIYEAVLTELNKLQAPSITLEDFNYFVNKGISQYSNRKYNVYDTNQQTSDDLRVLKSSTILTPRKAGIYNGQETDEVINKLYGNIYEVNLPDDYFHILNCICVYQSVSNHSCTKKGDIVQYGANRLTADMWGEVMNNYYMKPSYKRPYYYLHHVNTNENSSTNPIVLDENNQLVSGTDYTSTNNIIPTPPQTQFTVYYAELEPQNPSNYLFNTQNLQYQTVSDSLEVTINAKLLFLLAIPANKQIKSITEVATGDQTAIYTNRKYKEERVEVVNSKSYQLLFLGTGNLMSGQYTINFL